jgi:thiosulfate reductase cytochrome b subunit
MRLASRDIGKAGEFASVVDEPGSPSCERQAASLSPGNRSVLAVTKSRILTYTDAALQKPASIGNLAEICFSDGNTMSSLATTEQHTVAAPKTIQPAWVRVMHWINAVAMILMIMSGLQIYNASPLFSALRFSHSITLGGWLGGALLWHFAAMWLLMVNGLAYLVVGFATGRFTKKLLPISASGVISDAASALTFKLTHDDLSKYNQVQKLLYAGIIVVGVVIVLSGLSIWKPVQFQYLTALFGGYDIARFVHFFCMAAIVAFLVIHILLAILVPKSLRAMIIGR